MRIEATDQKEDQDPMKTEEADQKEEKDLTKKEEADKKGQKDHMIGTEYADSSVDNTATTTGADKVVSYVTPS